MHDFIKSLYVSYFMKKGRRYIESMNSRGDTVKKTKKPKKERGKTWDGISRPATNDYRENWMKIFKKNDE